MEKYDIRKEEIGWIFAMEGSAEPLGTYETNKEAVDFSRDYMKGQGAVLRIWKADGTSVQEERTYEKE